MRTIFALTVIGGVRLITGVCVELSKRLTSSFFDGVVD